MTNQDMLRDALGAFRESDFSLARDLCETLLNQNSKDPGALRILGQISYLEGDTKEAADLLEKSLKAKPDQHSIWLKLGDIKAELGDHQQAIQIYTKATAQTSLLSQVYLSRAGSYKALGQDEKAWADLDQAVKRDSSHGQTYRTMMLMEHPATKKTGWDQDLLQRLANRMFPREDAIHVHYALASYYENTGNEKQMWQHLNNANGLQKNLSLLWVEEFENLVTRSKEVYTPALLEELACETNNSTTPVFIVGNPRTGSTLLEQMLSRHPDIATAGETNSLTRIVGELQDQVTLLPYPEGLDMIEKDDVAALSKAYQDTLTKAASGKKFITDKLLSNGFLVGFIKLIMPSAKIIHIRRDPLDTAFSIYKNYFWEQPNPAFCSLKDIGIYARLMDDIMGYWDTLLPGFVHQVCYEDLVKNPETQLKKILEFIDLPWDANCLDHQGAEKRAETLSSTQAAKPLYSTSIGLGKKFEQELAPFQTAFNAEAK